MNLYDLPKSLTVGGKQYPIRTDFRAVLDVLTACNDPELDDEAKMLVMLNILLPTWKSIPEEHLEDACKKLCAFIDCGQKDDGKDSPRLIDWEHDAGIIIPAVNAVAQTEVRAMKDLHWWTFFGYFMSIRESLFSEVLNIRSKKAKHKKLEKWEREFYKENRAIIDLNAVDAEEIRKEKDNILKWL